MKFTAPRPWKIKKDEQTKILDRNGKLVVDTYTINTRLGFNKAFANAELIIKAVNQYITEA